MAESYIDCTPTLQDQSLCTRLWWWPCQSTTACLSACGSCDLCGVFSVLFCCPCRTCCGICPTKAELEEPLNEPEEIPYTQIFEMERKKRQLMKAQIN